jgi:glutamyl-tRNA reductase
VSLLALGVDHRSATASVREALAFDGDKLGVGLNALSSAFPGNEFVILSTCNRVEVYAAGAPDAMPEVDLISQFLADFHGLSLEDLSGHLVHYRDEGVVGHLFRVSASLESLVLGEGQILGQVRDAYRAAVERGTVRQIGHALFQQAIRVGKLVREQTGMDQGKLSVASVAVDVAREVFDTFHDKTVLVIGAGKMGDLTLRHLEALKPGRILITNRNSEKAEAAANRWGGEAAPFEVLNQHLIAADLIISTTAAAEPIVTYKDFERVQRARRNRLALILDIAIPRDFDPKIGDLDQVMLYNVDDLRAQAEQNRLRRQKGVDPALVIIEKETAACFAHLRHQQDIGAVLRQLDSQVDACRRRELDALFASRPNFSEEDREAIERMALRIQNQFLHRPRAAVRSAAADAATAAERVRGPLPHDQHQHNAHPLLNAVRHLFGLADYGNPQVSRKSS